jgi:hypothetical protein
MRITKENINEFIDRTRMYCSNKGITKIDYIPEGITHLHLGNNKLTQLLPMGDSYGIPKLPNGLTHLYCYNNKLTQLLPMGDSYGIPKLPDSLIRLDCGSNNNLPYKVTINNFREHNTLLKRKEILSKICV